MKNKITKPQQGGTRSRLILQVLDNPEALQNWRERVGHAEAERISKRSSTIGTAMHKFIEHWICDDKDCVDLTEEGILGRKMAQQVYDHAIKHKLEDCWHMESKLKFGDHYHGRLDLAGIYYHQPVVIDFKQSNKPKRKEWCWGENILVIHSGGLQGIKPMNLRLLKRKMPIFRQFLLNLIDNRSPRKCG